MAVTVESLGHSPEVTPMDIEQPTEVPTPSSHKARNWLLALAAGSPFVLAGLASAPVPAWWTTLLHATAGVLVIWLTLRLLEKR